MTGTPARRFLRPTLLVAAALGVATPVAHSAPPVSLAASDNPKAAEWATMGIEDLHRRANAGEPAAMEEFGRRLLAGVGMPRDAQTGARWYQRAADGGSPTAAFTIGVLYERGIGVERDSIMAVEWYRKAVAGNVAAAKHNLALMLRDGRGAPQNGPRAVELLRAAARQGMTASMFTLGDMYERGGAVLKDPAAALAWFAIATELELQAQKGAETTLARTAHARGQAVERTISGADRERAEKIGQDEFRQILAALAPKPPSMPASEVPAGPPSAAAATPPPAPPPAAVETPGSDWPKAAIDQVKVIQQALIDLKLLKGKVDGDAGRATRAAIRDFEKSAGLPETGQPSREVHAALVKAVAKLAPEPASVSKSDPAPSPEPSPVVETWPAKGPDQIRAIQRLLVELKLLDAEPTGTVGPLTRRAIRDFQRKAGLKETGEPSQALFNALKAARARAGG
ncbi:MAG TPA: SEL1-like repeat protein [Reyranella sp.]|nr:SEL1-like repeat protein [Reyranella sp.]